MMGLLRQNQAQMETLPEFNDELDYEQQGENQNNDFSFDNFDTGMQNNAEVQKIRLDTDPHLNKIRLFIENKYIKETKVHINGQVEYVKKLEQIPNTKPLANPQGISQIMGFIGSLVSKDIVQAYLDKNDYHEFMGDFIISFVRQLVINSDDWGIKDEDIRSIRKVVTYNVELYLTRAIGGKDRELFSIPNNPPPPQQQGGWMDRFKWWRQKRQGMI